MPFSSQKNTLLSLSLKIRPINWYKTAMEEDSKNKVTTQVLKTFILENRDLFRFFLRQWLEGQNGHLVTFFDSAEAMENNPEPRDLEMLASHLLPTRMHFKRDRSRHGHAVYGDGLDASTILWCRKSGVGGILDLRDGIEDWGRCLERVRNGETAETSSARNILNQGHGKGLPQLSRRETEVARMLVKGFSAKQVASALGTTEGTVKNQRKAVYRKLGIVRATQLAGAMGFKPR